MCEFINNISAEEKWTIDLNEDFIRRFAAPDVKILAGDNTKVELPDDHFDLVFVSNFLEHLSSQAEVAAFLSRMFWSVKPGGRIAVMGPNFKYAWREYFDFADHTVCLSELGAAEQIVGAGFTVNEIVPRLLPLSFRGRFPINRFLVRTYLKVPAAWRFFGKQFLIIGEK